MFKPDDPLAPNAPVFEEPWHAQVLALADTMIRNGSFSQGEWAQTLGAALKSASDWGERDNTDTYFQSAVSALEQLTAKHTPIDQATLTERKSAWTRAYKATPHGQPVRLAD